MRESLKEIKGRMKAGSMVKSGYIVLGRDVCDIQRQREDKLIQDQSQEKIKRMILTEIQFSKKKKYGM